MDRKAGSFIRNKAGDIEENLKDPAMKKRKELRDMKHKGTVPGITGEGVDSGLSPEREKKEVKGDAKK